MFKGNFGTKYQGKILVYTKEFDAKRTAEKIKKGITEFGWNNEEIQPCMTMVPLIQFKGTIFN